MSPIRMTPRERAAALLTAYHATGDELRFIESAPGSRVHVVGPAEDQPGYTDVVDWLLRRKFRAVCGRVLHLGHLDGEVSEFDDERLCQACHEAFGTPEDQAVIFECNQHEPV